MEKIPWSVLKLPQKSWKRLLNILLTGSRPAAPLSSLGGSTEYHQGCSRTALGHIYTDVSRMMHISTLFFSRAHAHVERHQPHARVYQPSARAAISRGRDEPSGANALSKTTPRHSQTDTRSEKWPSIICERALVSQPSSTKYAPPPTLPPTWIIFHSHFIKLYISSWRSAPVQNNSADMWSLKPRHRGGSDGSSARSLSGG